jgi:hypothetical protein
MHKLIFAVSVLFAMTGLAQDKPRVYVTDSQSWEVGGGAGGVDGTFGGSAHGGARPQTAEIVKTFNQRCPEVVINNKREKANYVVVLDHEGGKGGIFRDNKIAIFNPDGDGIFSRSTRSLGNAVQDGCKAITRDWSDHKYAKTLEPKVAADAIAATPEMKGSISVASNPAAADIEVDGAFVGSTPSSVTLAPGDHAITVSKKGYAPWQKKIRVTSGQVNIMAELEPAK